MLSLDSNVKTLPETPDDSKEGGLEFLGGLEHQRCDGDGNCRGDGVPREEHYGAIQGFHKRAARVALASQGLEDLRLAARLRPRLLCVLILWQLEHTSSHLATSSWTFCKLPQHTRRLTFIILLSDV